MRFLPSWSNGGTRPSRYRGVRRVRPCLEQLEDRLVLSAAVWTPQGPGPIQWGQPQGMDPQKDPDIGSVAALAADPNNANILYAATTSGGIWMTTNATASYPNNPTWTPLTDNQSTLEISSLAISPLDSDVLYAGTGNHSSGLFPNANFKPGGLPEGVLKSSDGGQTWTLLDPNSIFQGQNIRAIVPSTLDTQQGQLILAATYVLPGDPPPSGQPQTGGVYESNDGGNTWTLLSGASNSGLPAPTFSPQTPNPYDASLVEDPGVPGANRPVFYTSVFDAADPTEDGVYQGVYNSSTNSVQWTLDNGSGSSAISSTILDQATNLKLAVHPNGNSSTIYLLTNDPSNVSYVFYSTDGGTSWTEMQQVPNINNGNGRGDYFLAVAADPTSPSVVFVTGSTPSSGNPEASYGIVYRGDWSQPSNNQWTIVVGPDGATGTPPGGSGNNATVPHTDSKALVFDAQGDLLLGDDGGVYKLVDPDGAVPTDLYWVSVNGNLQDNELYAVGYDSIDHTIIGGSQDNGMSIQPYPGAVAWNQGFFDDVLHVAVDDHGPQAVVYGMGIDFDLHYGDYSTKANNLQEATLASSSGGEKDSGLSSADQKVASADTFTDIPFALNAAASGQLMLGYNNLYESTDQGNVISELTLPNQQGVVSAIAYGGYSGNSANSGVAYVGTSSGQIFVRTTADGVFTQVPFTFNGAILNIALDPSNWQIAYMVVNNTPLSSQIWETNDAGNTWTNVTGNLAQLAVEVDTVTVVNPTLQTTALVAGGLGMGLGSAQGSIFATVGSIDGAATSWQLLGSGLPDVMVSQVVFNSTDDVLVAGTYGRGAWTLDNAKEAILALSPSSPPTRPSAPAFPASVWQQLVLDVVLLPTVTNAQGQASLAQQFDLTLVLGALQSASQIVPLLQQEALLWVDLASGQMTTAIDDADVLAANPLYNTPIGYSVGLLEGEWILSALTTQG